MQVRYLLHQLEHSICFFLDELQISSHTGIGHTNKDGSDWRNQSIAVVQTPGVCDQQQVLLQV
jgi:hypothetical protein